VHALANGQLNPLFLATVQGVEESIVNAMVAAETMTGVKADGAGDRYRRAAEDPENASIACSADSYRARQSTTKRAPLSVDCSTCAEPPCHSTIRFDDRQPETEAGLLARRPSQLHERVEDALAVRFGDAGSIVLDAQSVALLRDDRESHSNLAPGVTNGVVEQVAQHGLHQVHVAHDRLRVAVHFAVDAEAARAPRFTDSVTAGTIAVKSCGAISVTSLPARAPRIPGSPSRTR
jgi:hypothetical protein